MSAIIWLADTRRRIGRWHAGRGEDAAALACFEEAFNLARRAVHLKLSVAAGHEVFLAHDDLLRRKQRDGQGTEASGIGQAMLELAQKQAARYPYQPIVSIDLKTALELCGLKNGPAELCRHVRRFIGG
jgi:hypothetical protein